MPLTGIRIERDVRPHKDVGEFMLDGGYGAGDQTIWIETLVCRIGFQLLGDFWKEHDGLDSQCTRFRNLLHDAFERIHGSLLFAIIV